MTPIASIFGPLKLSLPTSSHPWHHSQSYHEHEWDKRPWLKKCGGCHATGVDLDQNGFKEPGVGCEACHGPGSHHAALPKTKIFKKRASIVNPDKLTAGVAVQICGSCHNRGKSTKVEGAGWPVGFRPGKALTTYYDSTSYAGGDVKHVYANEFSKGHHQLWVHRVEAVLAMIHIFTIHFFVEHWRPRCFPYSATMFEGSKSIEHLREEHPAWIARMEAEGTLKAALCRPAPVPLRILYFGVGYALIGLGVFLLVFGLLNVGLLTLNF